MRAGCVLQDVIGREDMKVMQALLPEIASVRSSRLTSSVSSREHWIREH